MNFLKSPYCSPYFAGIIIGLLQIPVYFLGASLGTSKALYSLVCTMTQFFDSFDIKQACSACFLHSKRWWQLGFVVGIIIGAWISKRMSGVVRENPIEFWKNILPSYSPLKRYVLAFVGGFFLLFGALLADGCMMGNGVSGISLLFIGSCVVMISAFSAAFLVARFYKI